MEQGRAQEFIPSMPQDPMALRRHTLRGVTYSTHDECTTALLLIKVGRFKLVRMLGVHTVAVGKLEDIEQAF